MLPQNKPDRIRIVFDDHRLVANAGLLLPATLARHLGLRELVDHHLDLGGAPGRANTGDKMLTLVASALAGGDCIDDADALRAGGTVGVLGCVVKAPSTLGTFLRSFRWGHVRQLDRVMDTPITESAFVGAAVGAATAGLRPVVELMFNDFMGVCFDQILNQAAKFRYMFGGKAETPLVVRTMYGAGIRAAAQHSQSLYGMFTNVPGLKCVVPATPYDAKGMLIQSIRDNDPVIFFEHKQLYQLEGEVPEESYTVPFAEANILREGDAVTIVALGHMVHLANDASGTLAAEGIQCEVIDLRTTSPMDEDTILESVEKTGRMVVVDESSPRCNIATDVSALVAQNAFGDLKAPIKMVTAPHTPVPFSDFLEDQYKPDAARIVTAVREVWEYRG